MTETGTETMMEQDQDQTEYTITVTITAGVELRGEEPAIIGEYLEQHVARGIEYLFDDAEGVEGWDANIRAEWREDMSVEHPPIPDTCRCGSDRFQEVTEGIVDWRLVDRVDHDEKVVVIWSESDMSYDGSEVVGYECRNCLTQYSVPEGYEVDYR